MILKIFQKSSLMTTGTLRTAFYCIDSCWKNKAHVFFYHQD